MIRSLRSHAENADLTTNTMSLNALSTEATTHQSALYAKNTTIFQRNAKKAENSLLRNPKSTAHDFRKTS